MDGRGIEDDLQGEDVARGVGKWLQMLQRAHPGEEQIWFHHLCCLLALYLEQGLRGEVEMGQGEVSLFH